MGKSQVLIIFDPEFGTELRSIPMSMPVWIVDSSVNNPIVAEYWQAKLGDITSFHPQSLGQLIDTVDQHHPDWCELEILGSSMASALSALDEYGPASLEPTARGFTLRRSVG